MQTAIADAIKATGPGMEADKILRTCVHCGFCNATCPTYLLLGDELDGPRGRIYLIKQALEGAEISTKTLQHLDRCLTCRNCETTCPSGVRYGDLLEIGRDIAETQVRRPLIENLKRKILRLIVPYPKRFNLLLQLGRTLRPILPHALQRHIPLRQRTPSWPAVHHHRRVVLLEGCVQSGLAPNINAAMARVLDRLGISAITARGAGCCGAVSHHLSASAEALNFIRRNIDAWWPHIQSGADALVMTASGCGVMVKDYGRLLRDDPHYADKAARISEITKDSCEILAQEDLSVLKGDIRFNERIAFHSPCTLQHGQKLSGATEKILAGAGYQLVPVTDAHLCCGSAGTYSILQHSLAQQLLVNKLKRLEENKPTIIATANIGCLTHLQTRASVPVCHWIELLVP